MTKDRFYIWWPQHHHRKYPRDWSTFLTQRLQCTLGLTVWIISEPEKWTKLDNTWCSCLVAIASVSVTRISTWSLITECAGDTLNQNIGISSTTSSHGELSYHVSSSHAAFKSQTDRDTDYSLMYGKVKLHAKRECIAQKLQANYALTLARHSMSKKWRSSWLLLRNFSSASL